MYSIYSSVWSKNHLFLEQQNKLLISPVWIISEPEWISEDNQT